MKYDCTVSDSKDLNGFHKWIIRETFMKFEHCLRCNSKNLEKGVIFDYSYGKYRDPMEVNWKIAPHIRGDSAPIEAIICKSCGHIELVISNYSFKDPHQYQCPHCNAIYYYMLDSDDETQIVECQNCGKKFTIETDDVLDEIEKEFED
jgi:transcription elongation factor Elf1